MASRAWHEAQLGPTGRSSALLGRSAEPQAETELCAEDPLSPTSTGNQEARFHVELKRVSSEVDEVHRRQLSTRRHLEQVKRELSSDSDMNLKAIAAYQEKVNSVRAEVATLVDNFRSEWETFQPVNEELQVLAAETDVLTERDQRMSELLERMSRKLDFFDETLGSNLQRWG